MADFVELLVEMGFDKEKSSKALEMTGNKGVEAAMEWMLQNPDVAGPSTTSDGNNEGVAGTDDPPAAEVPKSYKCEDCGKIFTKLETVEYHAAKTNHSNFSESTEEKKPLTDEERAEQSAKLLELMKQKRVEREEKEKKEAIQREKERMASGRDLGEAKRRLQEQEMKELIEERRREKVEEKAARDKVKGKIEEDKAARRAKMAAERGEVVEPTPVVIPQIKKSDESVAKKDYTESKLQLRFPTGKTIVQSFGNMEPLAAVRVFVEVNRADGETWPFNLMTNFPKRVFDEDDYAKPLQALGLVPSAVLMITRKPLT